MLFLGLMFPKDEEKEIIKKSNNYGVQNQINAFQWNCIDGLIENDISVKILNFLPVGNFPSKYSELFIKNKIWKYKKTQNYQIGNVNLPLIKQLDRTIRLRRILKKSDEKEILIYSTYLPFLLAITALDKSCHISLIVTDLPEFYDLENTSTINGVLRKINNQLIYHCLKRINSFVLLTGQMTAPLNVGDRPYIIVEGICSNKKHQSVVKNESDKKVIFYSGALHYKFGIKNLIDAFSLIDDSNVELWICGRGEAEDEIRQRSQEDKRVKFFGFCSSEKVFELRSHATVLVNPRTNDGEYTKYSFPSKTMEYMASGIPVVMYKLDGVPEEYSPYLYYVDNNGTDSLKETLSRVIYQNDEERTEFGKRASSFVLKEKSAKKQAKKIITLMSSSQ